MLSCKVLVGRQFQSQRNAQCCQMMRIITLMIAVVFVLASFRQARARRRRGSSTHIVIYILYIYNARADDFPGRQVISRCLRHADTAGGSTTRLTTAGGGRNRNAIPDMSVRISGRTSSGIPHDGRASHWKYGRGIIFSARSACEAYTHTANSGH